VQEITLVDVAYWPHTFLEELEAPTAATAPVLWALGGPSFLYRTAQATIWIDPYFAGTPDDAVPGAYRATAIPVNPHEVRLADVVISTHDHVDHCHEGTVMPILGNTEAFCVGPRSSARLMREWGVPDQRLKEVTAGDTFDFRDVRISVHESYDPNEPDAATFILESSGVTLFVSGDTSRGPALAQVGSRHRLDFALLAFGRTWYMSEEELIEAATDLAPETLLPFHWEFWRNHTGDVVRLFEAYHRKQREFDVKMLLVGDSLVLEPRKDAER
jgi:L-ascorbate 6-phosphate lactonase